MIKKQWTNEQDKYLIDNYNTLSALEISVILNKPLKGVQKRATRLGLRKRDNRTDWSPEEEQILIENYLHNTENAVKLLPHRTIESIRSHANRIGLKKYFVFNWTPEHIQKLREVYPRGTEEEITRWFPGMNMHAITEYARKRGIYREIIANRNGTLEPLLQETNEAYYWMGFIAADGCFQKSGQLFVTLAVEDIEHLQKLAALIKTDISIIPRNDGLYFKSQDCCRLTLMHKDVCVQLREKFDMKDRKTYNPPDAKIFEQMSQDQFLSFFTGFIDGDGSIHLRDRSAKIGIQNHGSWIDVYRVFANLAGKIFDIKINVTIDKRGYCRLCISRKMAIQKFYKLIRHMKLPVLERKWSKLANL